MKAIRYLLSLLLILTGSVGAHAASADAIYYVNQGIRFYELRDYTAAVASFEQAQDRAPGDLRIVYNLGCALMFTNETGDLDRAVEQFRLCAFAKNKTLAGDALLQLGDISIRKAKGWYETISARKNEQNSPRFSSLERDRILTELLTAEKQLGDCLLVDPKRREARKNLEIVRQWRARVQEEWLLQQRQAFAQRNSFTAKIELWNRDQRLLRNKVRTMLALPDSPKTRQSLYLLAQDQSELAAKAFEIHEQFLATQDDVLIRTLQHRDNANDNADASPEDTHYSEALKAETKKTLQRIAGQLETASKLANYSATQLREDDGEAAFTSLSLVVEKWNTLQCELRTYEELLLEAVKLHESLLSSRTARPEDPEEARWNQQFVKRWMPILQNKAYLEQDAVRSRIEAEMLQREEEQFFGDWEYLIDDFNSYEKSDDELLLESMELAVTLCPKIETLLSEAVTLLKERRWTEAKSKQIEARTLLYKILEPLEERTQGVPETEDEPQEDPSEEPEWEFPEDTSFETSSDDSGGLGEKSESNATASETAGENGDGKGPEAQDAARSESQTPPSLYDDFSPEKESEAEENASDKTGKNQNGTGMKSVSREDSERSRSGILEEVPGGESEYEILLRKAEQENADVLIRSIKRRQSEAKKYRETLRKMLEPENKRAPKDW